MTSLDPISVTKIPADEELELSKMIKSMRKEYIKQPSAVVELIFSNNQNLKTEILEKHEVSKVIEDVREMGWQEFLIEEADFNAAVIREISIKLKTPASILQSIIEKSTTDKTTEEIIKMLPVMCGEFSGRIAPYIYYLSLSNTQSRRARAGITFESIIYQIYKYLEYPFDSQKKIGRQIFEEVGLGKTVDSVLPSIELFGSRRDKAIIGTMKTTLRERWQEVAEEIERTKIPVIHLLTVDTDISGSKAREMSKHNIIVVALKNIADKGDLASEGNVISFEEYLFEEIPEKMKHWNM